MKILIQTIAFCLGLRGFGNRLRHAPNLHPAPDLNDGVVLNLAPFFDLAPWKEAKKYWGDMVQGKC